MNRIEVCFSPGEYHLYEADFQLVVVLDVLRATSAICTAMEHGVKEIIPVATVEEARALPVSYTHLTLPTTERV